jgi:single-stranded DNA-binding protein
MIDALIAGRMHGAPKIRTSQAGKRFATCTVRTATRDGAAVFVNVICVDAVAVTAVLALSDGDSVALAGELTPKVYTPQGGEPRPSLDLLAHAVISPYNVARKRKAGRGEDTALPFDDDLPGAA